VAFFSFVLFCEPIDGEIERFANKKIRSGGKAGLFLEDVGDGFFELNRLHGDSEARNGARGKGKLDRSLTLRGWWATQAG